MNEMLIIFLYHKNDTLQNKLTSAENMNERLSFSVIIATSHPSIEDDNCYHISCDVDTGADELYTLK